MKKLAALISLWILTFCAIYAQTPQAQPNNHKSTIVQQQEKINELEAKDKEIEANLKELSSHVNCLEYVVDKQNNLIEQEQSVIENQLTASSRFLEIFSLIIAVVGIALSVYISRKEKSMKGLLDKVSQKQCEVEATSQRMEKLNNDINKDIKGLYQRLRREETETLLKRLVDVPEDISNLSTLLISREISSGNFDMLLKAYTRLMEECSDAAQYSNDIHFSPKEQYLLLFFQNFCGKSIQTSILRKDLIEFFPDALQSAFRLDVKNSLLSLIETLNNTAIEGGNEIILSHYIIALNNSHHKDYTEPYQLIVNKCKDSINLQSIWDKLVEKKVTIEPFGNLLCEKYKEDTIFTQRVKEQIATLHQEKKDATPQNG